MTASQHPKYASARNAAEGAVYRYTLLATATGAIPVPAVTAAVIAENTAMVNEIASCFGLPISAGTVLGSMGSVAAVNAIGRAVFVEGARAMGWFGGPLGVAGISALGAATAGIQTFVLGFLAIAIAENGGEALDRARSRVVIDEAKREYDFVDWERVRQKAPTEP